MYSTIIKLCKIAKKVTSFSDKSRLFTCCSDNYRDASSGEFCYEPTSIEQVKEIHQLNLEDISNALSCSKPLSALLKSEVFEYKFYLRCLGLNSISLQKFKLNKNETLGKRNSGK
jgi:hypothetical protein